MLMPVPAELISATTPMPAPLMALSMSWTVPVGDQVMVLVCWPLVMTRPELSIPAPSLSEEREVRRVTCGFRELPTTGVFAPAPVAGVAMPRVSAVEPVMVMLSVGAPVMVSPCPVMVAVIPPTAA